MALTILSTGGTIASTATDRAGAEPSLTAADLTTAVPGLANLAAFDTVDVTNVPSTHLSLLDLADLVDRICRLDADPAVDGIVVTQGTDVLEECAYFVDLCYDGDTPVVFTGAMRTPEAAGADGAANLLGAARTALDDEATGALVVFADRVLLPREATKTHSMAIDAFRSPEFGPLATLDEDRVVWHRRLDRIDPCFDPDPDALSTDVPAITICADMSDRFLRASAECPAVCLAATGAGHVPPTILPTLESLRERSIPVIVTTRCQAGRVAHDTYGFPGSEQTLWALGCRASDVDLPKTRIRAIVALAAGRLEDAFATPT